MGVLILNKSCSPILLKLGEKCSQNFFLNKNYNAVKDSLKRKYSTTKEDKDNPSNFGNSNNKMPLYSGHVPTSLLQKGMVP